MLFVARILVVALLVTLGALSMALSAADARHALALARDRRLMLDSMSRRTARAKGIVIGGSPLMWDGNRLSAPLVRFEAEGKEHLATGPAIRGFRRGRKTAFDGSLVTLDGLAAGYAAGHSPEFVRAIDAVRSAQCGGEGITERWDLAYEDSALSKLLPVGSEVTVAYEPGAAGWNNMVLLPCGKDGSLVPADTVMLAAARAACELASAVATVALAALLVI